MPFWSHVASSALLLVPGQSLGNPSVGPTKSGKKGQVSIERGPATRQVPHCYAKLILFHCSFHVAPHSRKVDWQIAGNTP